MFLYPRSVSLYFTPFPHLSVDMQGNVYDCLNREFLKCNKKDGTVHYNIPGENKRVYWSMKYLVRRAYYSIYDDYDEDDIKSLSFIHASNYIICCDGRVFNRKTWDYQKYAKDFRGYWRYTLVMNDGTKRTFQAHRLVAQAFLENPNDYTVVDHKDCDPSNNHVSNLAWVDQKENVKRAISHGHHPVSMISMFFGDDTVKKYTGDNTSIET